MHISQKLSLIAIVVAVVGIGASAASAETPSPWWGITTGSRPTNLRPGVAQDEVQKLTISATGGHFVLKRSEPGHEGLAGLHMDEVTHQGPSAAEVQKALEESEDPEFLGGGLGYGKGNVQVTGGPGDEAGDKPYVITFVGQLADQPIAPIIARGKGLAGLADLTGGREEIDLVEATHGNPDGQLIVEAQNLGDAAVQGCSAVPAGQGKFTDAECSAPAGSAAEGVFEKTPTTITDTLPEGLRAVAAEGIEGEEREIKYEHGVVSCAIRALGKEVTCTYGETPTPECGQPGHLPCTPTVPPFEQIELRISAVVGENAKSGEVNTATVSGGGAAGVRTATHGVEVNGSERFGTETYSLAPEQLGGAVDTQAGSHPFQLTSVINANTTYSAPPGLKGIGVNEPRTVALVKDDVGELPAGLVGNPTPFEQCTDAQFATKHEVEESSKEGISPGSVNDCPASSAVGVALVHFATVGASGEKTSRAPIFNMVPLRGEPARFGFLVHGIVPVFLNASVRTGGDYGVTVSSHSIVQVAWLPSVKLTFWGVPGSPLHDHQRGWECLFVYGACGTSTSASPPPFLTMPTSCGAFRSTLLADSWPYEERPSEPAKPATYELEQNGHPLSIAGCNHLPFSPSITASPDVPDASTSTGLTTDVHVPQTAELNPEGLAESSVKDITVALPAGVAVNPAGADGLEGCSEHLVGYEGEQEFPLEPGVKQLAFSPRLPGSFGTEGSEATLQPGVNFCANASEIGTVNIKTPLLAHELTGAVYLATQNANPFGSLLAMYIVAEDPVSGTVVKLPGEVSLNGQTGQLTATFNNSPELPFEDAVLHFFGGERAPLATPSRCGAYTTTASFAPWSGNPVAASESTFDITSGPNGSACTYPGQALPFSPSLTGGATNVNAGSFSPFTATMSRKDGEQNLQSLEVHLPPGLSGVLSGVELCPEPQANLGECGPNSLIGETTVSVGVGGDPFSVRGGKFYITGPYNGSGTCNTPGTNGCAPFGITFEVPAKAGPFDLERNSANPAGEDACDCVIVRGKIEINPFTSALTITSDPPGSPYAIPTSIEGIPLEIQHVNAITTRSNFQFNPTNCAKMAVTGTIHSSENATDTISVPSQVTNCRSLAFTPKFKVSTNAHTSRAKGASLTATVSEPAGSLGTQSNLAKVKVELPKQLPSRLTTLQKACTSKQFELNPANCPSESKIGYAKVITPLVPVPLEGPAIFVSHGGEAFPSLEIVLQGYGVTIDLVGSTYISKSGITSTTFKTVPDQPFSSFALTLPTGKFSALTALGNVCAEKLTMPTEFVAQNGAEIHQTTAIGVTGCKKTKALTRAQKLKAALKACHRDKNKAKREACERTAHKRFGPIKAKKGRKK
jgi:hypothetical protein